MITRRIFAAAPLVLAVLPLPALAAPRTLSGTDVIVSDFSDHPVVRPLAGSQIVLEKPVAFTLATTA